MNTNIIELLNPGRQWKIGTFGHLKLFEVAGNIDFRDPTTLNSVAIIRGEEPNIIIIDPNNINSDKIGYTEDFSNGIVEIHGSLDIKDKLHVENINFSNKRPISLLETNNNFLVTSTDWQDLSNVLYNELTPRRNNSRIIVNAKINYFCSVAFSERINIQLWRENVLLSEDISLGTLNSTGGLKNTYTVTFMDLPNNLNNNKYYIKFKLENNNSLVPQGIVDINTSSTIILYEIS
tara:strand:- start:3665 stop:4369 length:705 start_codon:yes stop_codon:yes gene_type:complete